MKISLLISALLLSSFICAQQMTVEKAPSLAENPVQNGVRDTFNLQFQFPASAFIGEYGIESDGEYIYVTQWRDDSIAKYDLTGAVVEVFSIPGVAEVRDLAWDGTYFYGSPNDYKFYVLDLTNKVLVNTCYTEMRIRGMAYDPDLDALWVSEHWSPSFYRLDKADGTTLDSFIPSGLTLDYISGLAYDNISPGGPFLWGFSQDSTGAVIIKYDIPNQAQTGSIIDVSSLAAGAAYAGGLFIEEITGLTGVSLGGMIQNDQVFGLELGYANALVGITESQEAELRLYPNPVTHFLNLETNIKGPVEVIIYTPGGQVAQQATYAANPGDTLRVPADRLKTGIYLVQLRDDEGLMMARRFIKN